MIVMVVEFEVGFLLVLQLLLEWMESFQNIICWKTSSLVKYCNVLIYSLLRLAQANLKFVWAFINIAETLQDEGSLHLNKERSYLQQRSHDFLCYLY